MIISRESIKETQEKTTHRVHNGWPRVMFNASRQEL